MSLELENALLARHTATHIALKILLSVVPNDLAATVRALLENEINEIVHAEDAYQPINIGIARELQKLADIAAR